MPDYRKMYYKMVDAAAESIRILLKAYRECDEISLDPADNPTQNFPLPDNTSTKKKRRKKNK